MWSWYFMLVGLAALISFPLLFFDLGPFKKLHRIILTILILIALVENWCWYLANNGKPNIIYYNAAFVYITPILYLYFFHQVFQMEKVKNTLQILGGLFLLFGLLKTLFLTSFEEFHHDAYIIGSLLIIGCSFYFFYSIVSKNLFIETDLIRFPVFWIVTFLFFFYTSSILNFASIRFVTTNNYELMRMMQNIINGLGALMYLVFAFSFYMVLGQGKKKNSLSKV